MANTHLWIRAESRPGESRAPLVPRDISEIVERGFDVSVEESPSRVFDIQEYAAVGARVVEGGSWPEAPDDAFILGIKELPEEPYELRHAHIYFAHAFKGQEGATRVLDRFQRGGGELLDVEYLTAAGTRVVAFGYWAGYVGAGLAVMAATGRLQAPLRPFARADFDAGMRLDEGDQLRALVIGSAGRSGTGAREALSVAGAQITGWDRRETADLDHDALLDHDLLVNCVVSTSAGEGFIREQDAANRGRRLRVVSDVTCDVTSAANLIPVNTEITTWDEPVRRVASDPTLDVIAIDNLPSLLPREASEDFSAHLMPLLEQLPTRSGPWAEALAAHRSALGR